MRLRSGSIRIDRKLTSSALRRDLQQKSIQAAAVINSATVKTVATQPASAPGGSLSARLSPAVSAQLGPTRGVNTHEPYTYEIHRSVCPTLRPTRS